MLGGIYQNILLGVHGSVIGVYWGASRELTWERNVKQDGSVSSRASGSVHESVLGSVRESVLRAYLGLCNEVHLAVLLNAA